MPVIIDNVSVVPEAAPAAQSSAPSVQSQAAPPPAAAEIEKIVRLLAERFSRVRAV